MAWELSVLAPLMRPGAWLSEWHLYRDAGLSWLAGDGFYHARQLSGPYHVIWSTVDGPGDILYPPTLLWVLVPLGLLPAALGDLLWVAIPAAVLAWSLWRLRPPAWCVALLVLPWAQPDALGGLARGNPVIWVEALTWAGLAAGWGGAFVWLKPSLLPFALIGIRRRGWWLVTLALAALTLPLLPLVPQFARVVLDSDGGLLYSLGQFLLMAAPAALWAARGGEPGVRAART